ncbi:hypothetical protein H2199_009285 [Coniosporium tulheliwenetii]|uniref:Uncharacterized protein n=1 Tax=Coniosporium tulheliwenetii TaxID=3383036 RepID=A0ACC2YED7_9PEZI|nr:hypothetical protein H2199_009285 [Cladosporium sp. JES 115]
MCEFRKTIHYVIARAQQQAEDLLFSWWPEVKLELIRDNLATHRPGYSFLADPVNQLQNSFRVLSRRAFSKEIGFSVRGAGRGKAIDYLRGRDRLVQFLYAAIHLTSGMPARGEELRMIRWADTTVVARNIFIYQGQIILVFSYNKANTNHNNSFYIIAVSIAKKHLPSLIKPFDPNTPKDYNGFLRLLSFQSGHKPLTHAGTYALEREFPAKLQPDLIDRYLENSHVWHEFALIRENDVVDIDVDCNLNRSMQLYEPLGYNPDEWRASAPERFIESIESPTSGNKYSDLEDNSSPSKSRIGGNCMVEDSGRKRLKRKRTIDPCSPTTKRIRRMQRELDDLIRKREKAKRKVLGGGWSDYVWADARGPWETERLTRVMTRETEARIGNRLTTHDYRHAAVGIGRVVVGESFARGYQDEVGEIEEPEVEEDESPLELQNARTTVIGTGHYGVPVDIIKHLSVRSLETFRPLSELWHRFLGLASGQEKMKEVKSRDSGMGWERAMTGPPCRKRGVGPLSEREAKELALPKKRTEGQEGHDRKEDVRRAMQQVLGSAEVSFRSIEQEQAMYAVMAGQTPLVVVLPTGGGKSLLFMVPACLDEPGVTVVVVPYRALVEDLVDRLKRARIDCLEWKPGEVNPAAVVVVSADIAASWGFLNYASLLGRQGLLRRVVIDECHLTFTASDWRPKLAQLRHLRVLACPIVLLTATLPPVLEEELSESMLVRCATYIRASTVRPNIRYVVSWCQRGSATEMAVAMCRRQARWLGDGGRKGVIYCRSKEQCEDVARSSART